MDLRRIRYFVAAAEDGHFRRAAQRVHISEPALGAQIRELEREMGIELFQRLPRGVRLTTAGRAFLAEARDVLAHLDRAIAHAQSVARGEAGVLRLGHAPRVMLMRSGTLIPIFCTRYPNVEVQAMELSTAEQCTGLIEGRIDVGIAYTPPSNTANLRSEVLDENLMTGALLPASHPLAHKIPLHCRDLSALPLLMDSRGNPSGVNSLVRQLRARGLDVQFPVSQISDLAVRLDLIAGGGGWLPASRPSVEMPGVVFREWDDPPIPFPCCVVWRDDDESPLVATFVATARELAQTFCGSEKARTGTR